MIVLVIKYKNTGQCIADDDAEEWVDKIICDYKTYDNNKDMIITIANELLLLLFRVKVKEGRISYEDIIFKYSHDIPDGVPNKYGSIESHPISTYDDLLERVLSINKRGDGSDMDW